MMVLITIKEAELLRKSERLRDAVIRVDAFADYGAKNVQPLKPLATVWKPVIMRPPCVPEGRAFFTVVVLICWMMMPARFAIHIPCLPVLIIRVSGLNMPG